MTKELVTIKTGDLVPYENNPRNNDGAVEGVKESINQVGYITPIIVDENNVILAGHTRLKSIQEIGAEEVEVLKVGGLSEEEKRKFRILDNKTNEFASWDFAKLELELDDLDFGDFDFGFDLDVDFDEPKEQKEVELKEDGWQIIIDCTSEADARMKFDMVQELGLECRLSTL